ncbi:hypothetical protein E5D57_012493 [Metarhizium anisopliae]|nr:hypothetical protein E5D57_012493 [Metarhizium anisopliae]
MEKKIPQSEGEESSGQAAAQAASERSRALVWAPRRDGPVDRPEKAALEHMHSPGWQGRGSQAEAVNID